MFGIGSTELIIIIVILLIILLIGIGVIFLVRALLRPPKSNSISNQSERLKELQKAKSDGLITEDELKKKRNEILNNF